MYKSAGYRQKLIKDAFEESQKGERVEHRFIVFYFTLRKDNQLE